MRAAKNEDTYQSQDTQLTLTPYKPTACELEEVPGLTVLAHADPTRVGERTALAGLAFGQKAELARLEPLFEPPRADRARALEDRTISRRPVLLAPGSEPGGLLLDRAESRGHLVADGESVAGTRRFSAEEVERGVVLQLGRNTVLLLHRMPCRFPTAELCEGLVGESLGMLRVRQEISRLAGYDLPVLLRGATGTGKELVARALHRAGSRWSRSFVAVNMATVTPSLAASELFGTTRGAFTGASRDKEGLFTHAAGGTLFLDEMGETPREVQPMLLRALEQGEILPVGAVEPQQVDVRVIAATDSRLEEAMANGDFRVPLFHRLAGYTIHLPTLAERRDDIGRLLYCFLAQELERFDQPSLDDTLHDHPWPPAEVVARLVRHEWPGNVRELRNVARWLAITGRDCAPGELLTRLEDVLREADGILRPPRPTQGPADRASAPKDIATRIPRRRKLRKPDEVDDEELRATLAAHCYKLSATAVALGISRANLYRLIDAHPGIRKATDLERQEIETVFRRCAGNLEATAGELAVSRRGLKRQMTALGLVDG